MVNTRARKANTSWKCAPPSCFLKQQIPSKDEHIYERGKSLIAYEGRMSTGLQATGARAIGHDMMKGENFVGECHIGELQQKVGGTKDWRAVYFGVIREEYHTMVCPEAKDREEAKELAEARIRKDSFNFITGQGKVEGDAKLTAGAIVEIKGTGHRYDGEYIASEVVHELGDGGYITKFQLKRNMISEEAAKILNPGGMRTGIPSEPAPSVTADTQDTQEEEEAYEPLKLEILSVRCLDTEGNETAICSADKPLVLEAVCNASVAEGAEVTFSVYREGDEPGRSRAVEVLTGINRAGRAVVDWGHQQIRNAQNFFAEAGRRFFFTANSAGCAEVQSECVEVEIPGAPIWLVHGTTFGKAKKGNQWDDDYDNRFRAYIRELFGYDYYIPEWDGRNNVPSRIQGAQDIADDIILWRGCNPDPPLILIGFSHGGNVNKEIVNILWDNDPRIFVNTLINIGTPIRPDFRLNAGVRVGQHINVFNENDVIQVMGSEHTVSREVIDPRSGMPRTIRSRVIPYDPRRYPGPEAINIEVELPPGHSIFDNYGKHTFMHANEGLWDSCIRPHLRLPPPNYGEHTNTTNHKEVL